MLSRHAESIFWLGRYTERAADICRMLEVAYNAQLEQPAGTADRVCRDLLRVLYVGDEFGAKYDSADGANLNRFLVFDIGNPTSVAYSAREARSNVMNLRDVVPAELLESVNQLFLRVRSGRLERFVDRPHEIYETIASDCRRISGTIDVSMSRTDDYRFLMLGRMLERAEMTGRMIDVHRNSDDVATWMSVLRSLSGFHAFIRREGPLASTQSVVTFLLQEAEFPFSFLHCLRTAEEHAQAVSGTGTWQSPRELGRVSAELQYTDIPPVGSDALGDLVERLEASIRRVTTMLHEDLFQFGGDPALYSFEAH